MEIRSFASKTKDNKEEADKDDPDQPALMNRESTSAAEIKSPVRRRVTQMMPTWTWHFPSLRIWKGVTRASLHKDEDDNVDKGESMPPFVVRKNRLASDSECFEIIREWAKRNPGKHLQGEERQALQLRVFKSLPLWKQEELQEETKYGAWFRNRLSMARRKMDERSGEASADEKTSTLGSYSNSTFHWAGQWIAVWFSTRTWMETLFSASSTPLEREEDGVDKKKSTESPTIATKSLPSGDAYCFQILREWVETNPEKSLTGEERIMLKSRVFKSLPQWKQEELEDKEKLEMWFKFELSRIRRQVKDGEVSTEMPLPGVPYSHPAYDCVRAWIAANPNRRLCGEERDDLLRKVMPKLPVDMRVGLQSKSPRQRNDWFYQVVYRLRPGGKGTNVSIRTRVIPKASSKEA